VSALEKKCDWVRDANVCEEALLAARERCSGGLAAALIDLRPNLRLKMSSERAFGFQ